MSIPWADQPYPLLSTELPEGHKNATPGSNSVFTSMTLAHNLTIRHLNAIYLQATGIATATDISDFLFFCKTWIDELRTHHAGEESILFPMLDEFTGIQGVMAESEEQHQAFMGGIGELEGYIQRISASTLVGEYSGNELRRIIRGFVGPLMQHLKDEPVQLLEIGERSGGDGIKRVWDMFEARLIRDGLATWDKVRISKHSNNTPYLKR
ncbi:hypothetical protein BJX63DRAFT_431533 [Aspergillus granulosus]|uniref:Hemerythrin-like domain-containing protein n=1 Tax=Aspergillus granulosus TaxID=176169 RepID=A0ABR4HF71_9EURO